MSLGQGWHVPAQLPLAQSASFPQLAPAAHFGQGPPQSTSLSASFFTLSEHVGAWHARIAHTPLAQSPPVMQLIPSAHGAQLPPQSLAVSVPFWTPSEQLGAAQIWLGPQTPLEQSRAKRHFFPGSQGAHAVPPQSTSVSSAPSTPSLHEIDWHLPFVHACCAQSEFEMQLEPTPHGGQSPPPQSTSVSFRFFTLSTQLPCAHTPCLQ
jgi:hypothetical protein